MPVEQEQALNAKLAEFKHDPKAFMNRLPSKTVVQNGADSVEPFSDAAIAQQAFIDARDHQRRRYYNPLALIHKRLLVPRLPLMTVPKIW